VYTAAAPPPAVPAVNAGYDEHAVVNDGYGAPQAPQLENFDHNLIMKDYMDYQQGEYFKNTEKEVEEIQSELEKEEARLLKLEVEKEAACKRELSEFEAQTARFSDC
jgi:hypothetical protein